MAGAEEKFGGTRLADGLSSSIPVARARPAEVKAAYQPLDNEGLDWREARDVPAPHAGGVGGRVADLAARRARSLWGGLIFMGNGVAISVNKPFY